MGAVPLIADALEAAVRAGRTVGATAVVADRDGVIHESAHGRRAVDGDAPMTLDAVFRAYSMSKAVGSVAAMQLVERGLLDLDTPVEELVDDFATVRVLDGWDGDVPRFRDPVAPCTVRHLATHTSGIVYPTWNAAQLHYLRTTGGIPTVTGKLSSLQSFPMLFDPGTRWAYGPSTDWLGRVVEAVTGLGIDAYLDREILGPLAMTSSGVELDDDTAARRVAAHLRTGDGFSVVDMDLPAHPEFYGMGHAMHTTAGDYARFCRMILREGELDGARVLGPETVAAMSTGAVGVERQETVQPHLAGDIDLFPEIPVTHTVGFFRTERDLDGRRRAGSLYWAGLLNTHYWIDPAAGIAAVVMMQHVPFLDDAATATLAAFERAVYATTGSSATGPG